MAGNPGPHGLELLASHLRLQEGSNLSQQAKAPRHPKPAGQGPATPQASRPRPRDTPSQQGQSPATPQASRPSPATPQASRPRPRDTPSQQGQRPVTRSGPLGHRGVPGGCSPGLAQRHPEVFQQVVAGTRCRPTGGRGLPGTSSRDPAAEACVIRPGMLDQRLDTAQRLPEDRSLLAGPQTATAVFLAVLAPGTTPSRRIRASAWPRLVALVRVEPWVEHLGNRRMREEHVSHARCVQDCACPFAPRAF